MEVKIEKIKDNTAKLIITVDNSEFLKEEDVVFNKRKSRFNIPGFRKGHATKDMIFKVYGRGVFYEDTANECINKTYYDALKNVDEKVLSKPDINVVDLGFDRNLVYEATVAIAPDFKLAKYKGIEIPKTKVDITDDDIKAKLLVEQEKNARIITVDRSIKEKDIATINFEGFVDGKTFKGGKAENFDLVIGSHSFIDNFEDQLIGKKAGDELDVNVTFPENYGEGDLSGKPALFKVKINSVKEKQIPELNDEFASEVSEFDKLDDYKENIKKTLIEDGEKKAREAEKQKIVEKIVEDTDIDLSKEAIDAAIDDIIKNIENRLYYQRISLGDYLKMTGQTMESLRDSQKEVAKSNLKTMLILDKIGNIEKIEADDKKVDEEIEKMAKAYGMPVDKFKERYINDEERKNIKKDLLFPTVVDFLFDNAKIK